jgi:uncharacterized repeat protein (TIGR01451 family)
MGTTLTRSLVRLLLGLVAFIFAVLTPSQVSEPDDASAHPSPPFTDGLVPDSAACSNFFFEFLGFIHIDVPDAGWVPVNKGNLGFPKFVSATGEVTKSRITYTDYPDVHDSHDHNIDIFLDPGQESLLSEVNGDHNGDTIPDSLEVEWEAGILPNEFSGDGSAHFFPKWAWPSEGDRVWSDGHWIFDCGHPEDVGGGPHAKTEIHPARGVASMRQQMATLPGSGVTPVPVTATDLYIHGRSGVVTDVLECGQEVVLGTGTCTTPFGPHDPVADHLGTPIDDNYSFNVCLPPLPFDKAVPKYFVEDGPGNTLTVAPDLDFVDSTGACAADLAKFGPKQLQVVVPLDGSGATPDDVYARKIKAGWVFPAENLRHLKLTLNKMDLHTDKEPPGFDCECTFFWMNVDRAGGEWIRLADHATGNMNDYDDDADLLGDGEMGFSGAEFDFYVGNNMPYTVRANGYDGGYGDTIPGADCFDDHFGHHDFGSHVDLSIFPPGLPDFCYVLLAIDPSIPDNDDYARLTASFSPADYLGSKDSSANGEYELEYTVEEIPLTAEENGADLSLTKDCKPDEGALAGVQFTCTILVFNGGPGLPSNVVVDDVLLTNVDPSKYTLEPPTFTFAGITDVTDPCVTPETPIEEIPGGKEFKCEIGTVPIGGKAIITARITSTEGGDFNNFARVSSDSGDADLSNNEGLDDVHVTAVADLSVTKSDDPDPVVAGNTLTYTLSAHNSGPSTAVNVVASDALPSEVSVVSVSGTGGASCNAGTPGNPADPTRCAFDSMSPGANRTMTIVVKVKPDAVTNSVTDELIMFDDASVSSDTLDLDNSDNLDTEATTVQARADLVLVKSASGAPIAGTDILYEYRVSNNGPSVSRDVTFRDNLPALTSFVDAFVDIEGGTGGVPLACTISQPINQVLCPLGDIAPTDGVPLIIRVTVHISARVLEGTPLMNDADVLLTDTPDPDLVNSEDSVTVIVQTVADLVMTKTSDFDVIKASGRVIYMLTIRNDGPSDAKNVVVTDDLPILKQDRLFWLPGPPMCTKPDGGTLLTCTYGTIAAGTIKQIMVSIIYKGSRGIVSNTAEVTAATSDPDLSNNSSTKTILVGSLPKP